MITDSQVERWLREDLGYHDVTNEVSGEAAGRLVATESGVVAGTAAAVRTYEYLGVDVEALCNDGDAVDPETTVITVEGPAREVLRGERVVVNLVGHASGVATRTRTAVDAAREVSDDVRVAATRKTTPGLRELEKRAVVAGGGDTHRLDLSHMVMVKDNHIAAMGLEEAIAHFTARASFATKIEVEVDDPADASLAADAGADIVLLDNMTPDETRRGVEPLQEGVLGEASGGITLETLPEYAATGVDIVSMGSLTHSAPSLDYSFRVV